MCFRWGTNNTHCSRVSRLSTFSFGGAFGSCLLAGGGPWGNSTDGGTSGDTPRTSKTPQRPKVLRVR